VIHKIDSATDYRKLAAVIYFKLLKTFCISSIPKIHTDSALDHIHNQWINNNRFFALQAVAGHYFTGPGASELLQMKFQSLIQDEKAVPTTVEVVMGRRLKVSVSSNL
jgi:hypothetical protein